MAAQEPVAPMAFLRAKPIGVMGMIDQGEQDDKVCVDTTFGLGQWSDLHLSGLHATGFPCTPCSQNLVQN